MSNNYNHREGEKEIQTRPIVREKANVRRGKKKNMGEKSEKKIIVFLCLFESSLKGKSSRLRVCFCEICFPLFLGLFFLNPGVIYLRLIPFLSRKFLSGIWDLGNPA